MHNVEMVKCFFLMKFTALRNDILTFFNGEIHAVG